MSARRTREAIASDLRHTLTNGDDTAGHLVGALLVAIADLEGVWSAGAVRRVINKARTENGREVLP